MLRTCLRFGLAGGWLLALALCWQPAALSQGGALVAPDDFPDEIKVAALDLTGTANHFRLMAGANLGKAAKTFLSPEAQARWDKVITPTAQKQAALWNDFFAQAVIWPSCLGKEHGVAGLYNPWADALMLTAWGGRGAEWKMADFVFVSGESFRGEEITAAGGAPAWLREKGDLRVALARQYHGTLAVYNEAYPLAGELDLLPGKVRGKLKTGPAVEWTLIEIRLLHRIEMYQAWLLAKDEKAPEKVLAAKAASFKDALVKGDRDALQALFPKEQDAGIIKTATLVPQEIRQNMVPVFYLRREADAVIIYSSPAWPRYYLPLYLTYNQGAASLAGVQVCEFEASKLLLGPEKGKGGLP